MLSATYIKTCLLTLSFWAPLIHRLQQYISTVISIEYQWAVSLLCDHQDKRTKRQEDAFSTLPPAAVQLYFFTTATPF